MVDERRKDGELWERVAVLKEQVGRLVSDAESEKDTRRRVNADISERFKGLGKEIAELGKEIGGIKRSIWIATGAISAIVFVINIWVKHL